VVFDAARRRYFRLGEREADFLVALDGSATAQQLRLANAAGFSAEQVDHLLGWFGAQQLLEQPDTGPAQPVSRWDCLKAFVTGPDRWRLTLVDPDAFLTRHQRVIDALFTPAALAVYLAILLMPLAVPVSMAELLTLSPANLGPTEWLGLYVGMLVVIALHELAHAMTCKHFGGQVHRVGLMLLYLQPVVFCDVSDSWRFKEKEKKIAVALAGVFFQLLLSCLLYVAWHWLHRDVLLVFALVNVAIAALNLLPFVKLDGYWVAVHLLDEPNLRAKSFKAVFRLFVGRTPPASAPAAPAPTHHLVFGLLSLVTTTAFFGLGLQTIQRYAERLSPTFAVAVVGALLALGTWRLCDWVVEQLRQVRGA
jgi:putative peptide zinc metalloprotease protein